MQTMLDVICENFDRYTYIYITVHRKAEAMDKPATNIWKKSKYYQQCDKTCILWRQKEVEKVSKNLPLVMNGLNLTLMFDQGMFCVIGQSMDQKLHILL